ncbi:NAD-binding protein [Gemmiger sp. An120]|uniref:NAD-binding protein n=1 Tax=Gemmiger sp. An120 TaxID=1965549 RepID=UPI001FA93A85|nr:NAD-binding protein [Gemmiger sp. An120]
MARRKAGAARDGLNIILVGCGKVGVSLVEKLSQEGHNITVVDRQAAAVSAVTDLYDVSGVVGNGASYRVQQEAGIDEADILISVTASDELNLLCCTVAKKAGNCATIARVRTPDYSEDADYLKEKLGLAMVINPEREAALAIARLLCLPTALSVTSFAGGHAEMVRIRIPQGSKLDGRYLRQLGKELAGPVLVCAVERSGQVYIPDGGFQLASGDALTFICPSRDSKQFLGRMGFETHQAHNALLIGGSKAAYYLARRLLAVGVQVRIIEADMARCGNWRCGIIC